MKLKYFFTLAVTLVGLLFIACNSDNEIDYGMLSSDGQIKSFSVDAEPYTAVDSITYPALSGTKFSINNTNNAFLIFNKDSLPVNTDLRMLKLKLEYTTSFTPGLKLLYPKDSIAEWNGEDSVKIIKKDSQYYPRILTIAPNMTERTYTIDFRIHTQDPDSIRWHDMDSLAGFKLPLAGESKVLSNVVNDKFLAFIKNGSIINFYTSPIENARWSNAQKTNLPASALVKTISASENLLALLDTEGNVYTSGIADGVNWTKAAVSNVASIIGKLPEIKTDDPKNEFLIIYRDNADNRLRYGKTADFSAIEKLQVATRGDNDEILAGFPVEKFSSVLHSIEEEQALIVTGGLDDKGNLMRRSWRIANRSLASGNAKAEISVIPSMNSSVFPEENQVETFVYNEDIYAVSTDSLSLYRTSNGDKWALADKKQKLRSPMDKYGSPSVVVDKVNNIWIFGGVSKEGGYTRQIWRGKLNKLAFKE